jgi:hypothetical protein
VFDGNFVHFQFIIAVTAHPPPNTHPPARPLLMTMVMVRLGDVSRRSPADNNIIIIIMKLGIRVAKPILFIY